ncbi:MAG: tetratricopeptide repeat protein [Bacteroidota bacterium]
MIKYVTHITSLATRIGAVMVITVLLLLVNSCDLGSNNSLVNTQSYPELDSVTVYLHRAQGPEVSKKQSLAYLSKALLFARELKKDTLRRAKLSDIRTQYRRLNDLESYREVNAEIRVLAEELDDSLEIAKTYSNLGYYYLRKEKIDSAYSNYYLAQRMFVQMDSLFKAGKALLTMAIIQKNAKDYMGGEASSVAAIKLLKPSNDLKSLTSAYTNLGLISNELGRYDKALEYHEMALAGRKKDKDRALEVSSLNNIGFAYFNNKQYDKAIAYYEQGLAYDSLFYKRTGTYARLLDNLAFAKFRSGVTDELPQLFLRPLFIRDSIGDNLGAVTSHIHLAEYYKSVDSMAASREQALTALNIARPLRYHRETLEALDILSDSENEAEALLSSRAYIHISDSLQQVERGFREQFARIRFETESIETENSKVTKQNKQLFIGLLSLLALFLLVYIFIQRKLNGKELKFRESQQRANEEIYNLMLVQQLKLEEGKRLEKRRFSEELHDGVLGRLFGTRLSLDSLNNKHDDKAVQTRLKYLEELKNIEHEIRQISHGLDSTVFSEDVLFTEVIEQLIEIQNTLDDDHPNKFEFTNDYVIHWEKMPNNIKVHLYRIIQESLQNIHKHAAAKHGKVSLLREEDAILLRIEDDGVGMEVNKVKKGIGLKNIRSRVEQMKGILKVDSKKGIGTIITVQINY